MNNDNDVTIENKMNAGDFANSLTLAELAIYESTSGHSIGEEESTSELVTGMAVIAARRLGVKITTKDAGTLTLDASQELMAKAADKLPNAGNPTAQMTKLLAIMNEDTAGE